MVRHLLPLLFVSAASIFAAGPDVLTHHNDNQRTGENLYETILTPANVNSAQFGKLFDQSVDGQVYGQPLYVGGVQISGTTHNVVFVVTENDSVYAFDADDNTGADANPLWQVSFIDPANGITTVPSADVNSDDIYPQIGITSTPVIDQATSTIYVVAKTKENGSYFQRIHALDLATGHEKPSSPVTVAASISGNGAGSSNGILSFDPLTENQRCALLLLSGTVYIGWSSHGDNSPVHGWVIGYDAQSLARESIFNTTPNGDLADIWMSGCGPSTDAEGNIYFSTGNGSFDTNAENRHIGDDYGDSLLKLSTAGGSLALADYFTPANQDYLNNFDLDFGSGGVMLLPDQPGRHPHLGICTGKQGITFVFDRDKLGGYSFNPPNAGVYESMKNAIIGSFGTPAYYKGHIYYHGSDYGGNDVLKSFTVQNDHVIPVPVSKGRDVFPYPGSTPSISADGAANGIVWEIENTSPASLFASRADDVSQRIYTSNDAANSRDNPAGNGVKFTVPTVTNGKVYIGTDGSLTVFGLLQDTTPLTVNVSGSGTVTSGFAGMSERQTNTPLTITAIPSPGSVFESWMDVDGKVLSRSPRYAFTMSENLVLNANFVPFASSHVEGNYLGLIQSPVPAIGSAGYTTLSLGRNGVFTAVLFIGGHAINLRGVFNADGTFNRVLQPGRPDATTISLTVNGFGDISGTVTTGISVKNVTAYAIVNAANPIPAGLAGRYTLLFPVPSDPAAPPGIGFGSATVDRFGHVRLVGVLGDGTRFSEASVLTQEQTWNIFSPLYGGKGLLTGVMTFESLGTSDIDGPLFWYKPLRGAPPISAVISAIGSTYDSDANPMLLLASGTGNLTLQLPTAIVQPVTAAYGLKLSGSAPVTLTFFPANGFFGGGFTSGGLAGRYGGAIFQDQNLGQGLFFLSGSAGAMNLQ